MSTSKHQPIVQELLDMIAKKRLAGQVPAGL